MGRSFLKGNGGHIGTDQRNGTTGQTGTVSVRKHYLERKLGNYTPIITGGSETGILFQENWETDTYLNWVVVDDGTYGWAVSSADTASGTWAGLCINNSTGAYVYTNNLDLHLYIDIFVDAAITDISFDFDWKCNGESSFDHGYVWITDTGDTPTNAVRESTADKALRLGGDSSISTASSHYRRYNDNYIAGSDTTWVSEPTIFLQSGATRSGEQVAPATFVPGEYNRFIFSFHSDGSVVNNPPFGVDNIVWNYTASTAILVDPDDPDN